MIEANRMAHDRISHVLATRMRTVPNVFVTILQCAGSPVARRLKVARLRQARWAVSLHKIRRCGSAAFDVRYTLNSGAKSNVAGCPSWA